MKLDQVEDHLRAFFAAESAGAEGQILGARARAGLAELAALSIDCGPFVVAEDVLGLEINPLDLDRSPGAPASFGVLCVRRLFLQESPDDETSAVEVGFEFSLSPSAGLVSADPVEHQADITFTSDAASRETLSAPVFSAFDARVNNTGFGEHIITPDVFLNDHEEIL